MISILYFLLGIISYSFIEYAVHRWLLHGPMIKTHGEHHKNPAKHIQVPFLILVPALIAIWLLVGFAMTFGLVWFWFWSSILHWRLHVGDLTAPWILRLRKHHIGHHRNVQTNYGVSATVWDRLFGTFNPPNH